MEKIKKFEDLEVWQIGKQLVINVYSLTKKFPKDEVFGLTSQIKRAVLSVPANIAEGFGRFHYPDKAKFYLNARGSLYELKSHLLISRELGFCNETDIKEMMNMVESLSLKINNLIESTRKKAKSQ
jgi:four helix bundle protein